MTVSGQGHPVPKGDEVYVIRVAVVKDCHFTDDAVTARKRTAADLVEDLGPRRRSDVWWTTYYAAEGARVYADLYEPDQGSDPLLNELTTNVRAQLLIAWAIATIE